MMIRKAVVTFAFALAALFVAPSTTQAFPACDSFGQDWNINVGAFGGTFPGTLIVTGCRDCNQSLGCGHALALDGTAVVVAPANVVWTMTAFDSLADSCSSTSWKANMPFATLLLSGTVTNESGPFGAFTLTLAPCRATDASADGRDPSTN